MEQQPEGATQRAAPARGGSAGRRKALRQGKTFSHAQIVTLHLLCMETSGMLHGRSVAYSVKGLPPFEQVPPLGLFQTPPLNPKTGEQRAGVWAYKLAVSAELAQLAREVRARHAGTSKEAQKRMPYVGEYSAEDLGAVETLDVEVLLPPDYRHFLYWQSPDARPLARWVYDNLPDEVSWEGGEFHLRQDLFCYLEVRKGVERLHRFTPAGYRLVEHVPEPF
jgi:hypothetical protein